MKDQIKNLPLFKKVLLLSFGITFFVVISIASFSFVLQTQQMKNQLTSEVVGLASLWSATISSDDVTTTNELRDINHPAHKRLTHIVSLINEKNSEFLDSALLLPKMSVHDEITILVSSRSYEVMGVPSFTNYKSSTEYREGFLKAIKTDRVTYSDLYRDRFGLWITAFSPIKNEQGELVAVLSIDANASIIESFQKKIALYLMIVFVFISAIVYFILKRGLNVVLEPVNELIKGINEVSHGNFDFKLQVKDESDLSLLSEKFNHMTKQLGIIFDRLSTTSEQFGNENRQQNQLHKFEEALDEMENIIQKSKLQKELQRAEKMNAIGQLAASVAHEIRNPMTVVKGFLQIFLSKDELSKEEHMYIKLMLEELNRAENIINDYLSLAKPDIEHIEKVDARELGNKVMDLMNSYAMMSKSIDMKMVASESVFLKGNASELKQVLINILKNGIEAMKDGGTLNLRIYKEESFGVFEIEDTGIGMTQEELDRLGTAFYSLKEKGTGMGLMVCYQIIERMRGMIEVRSEKGTGTLFKIKVPLHNDSE